MALTDYERYQLKWMIEHGHSLGELMNSISMLQRDYEVAPDYNKTVGELFDIWERDSGFGGEVFASEAEWRDAEGKEPASSLRDSHDTLIEIALNSRGLDEALESGDTAYILDCATLAADAHIDIAKMAQKEGWKQEFDQRIGREFGTITKDMVREGIEHGVIRFEANPDPTDPWKTMCCVGEGGGLFYFVDTTDIPVSEYIRMNQNDLDMVVDDVWEALNGDIKRDFADDYERYATILSEPHQGGTSSLSLPEGSRMQAVGVGYAFNLLPPETVAGIGLKDSGTVVTVDGHDYLLMKGATFEDSRRVDALLDSHGDLPLARYTKPGRDGGCDLDQESHDARDASGLTAADMQRHDEPAR